MGDIADAILEGEMCQVCGVYMEDYIEDGIGPGFPQTCIGCQESGEGIERDDDEDF